MTDSDAHYLWRFEPSGPERYKRLGIEVASSLPEGWDEHAEWSVEASPEQARGYASTLALEEEAGDTCTPYVVTLYPTLMNRLSDSACRWVFAHEFAHIASKLKMGSIGIRGKAYTPMQGGHYVEAPPKNVHEDAADKIALEWGFDRELQSWLTEDVP
jgi:hypothetical protein